MSRYIGVDLAWAEGTETRPANETGLVCIDDAGTVLDAGWARGITGAVDRLVAIAEPGDVIAVDAPLVVTNPTGMRECERQVGQRYGRWKVAANATNLSRAWFGGVTLRNALETRGFEYSDGVREMPTDAVTFFECYPYTTIVGTDELGYDVERPRYKRANTALPASERRAFRARECDELLRRMDGLRHAEPALDLRSHPDTAELLLVESPENDLAYKHREDLLDAALCAWTAALWSKFGTSRCQILGIEDEADSEGRRPVIIAPAKDDQRIVRR